MLDTATALISGGTGTFGNAAVRRFLSEGVAEARIFSRDEKKQDDMRRRWAEPRIKFYMGDVRNEQSLKDAMTGVDVVFHAAALKQVPSGRCPVICCSRYGNIMASRGSVVPLFICQILAGQPLTVTDPHMTRFMMSIEGAVDLVLWALEHGNPGDIFVQKAPAATIETLAHAMRQVFKADNPIQVIGTRHGEKLYETLLTREEMAVAEEMGNYYRVAADNRDLNYELYFDTGRREISVKDDYNSHNTRRLSVDELAEILLRLDVVQRALGGEKPDE
jgi:UDP-N-acetylglucosamine 4,6-dehydratase